MLLTILFYLADKHHQLIFLIDPTKRYIDCIVLLADYTPRAIFSQRVYFKIKAKIKGPSTAEWKSQHQRTQQQTSVPTSKTGTDIGRKYWRTIPDDINITTYNEYVREIETKDMVAMLYKGISRTNQESLQKLEDS